MERSSRMLRISAATGRRRSLRAGMQAAPGNCQRAWSRGVVVQGEERIDQ
jgi:hypothetical protein